MCYWGIAFAYGPNINLPMMPEAAEPAWDAVRKGLALAANASPREKAYLDAVAARYVAAPGDDRRPLDEAFAAEMRRLATDYPDDADAQVFSAEALMDLQPWDYWEADGTTPKGNGAEIVSRLEGVLARWPGHPGALHLYIHAIEASATPERAEVAADRLLPLMPGAGHITHMPSHIYYRVGRYADARASNQAAVKADEAFFEQAGAGGVYPVVYFNHNVHFIWASAAMEGRSADAIEAAARLSRGITPELIAALPLAELFKPVEIAALTQFGHWSELLRQPWPPKQQCFATAFWHYARGFAHAATGEPGKAAINLRKLDALRGDPSFAKLEGFGVPARRLVDIAYELLAGEVARRAGALDQAVDHFTTAALLQDRLPYTEPPYWYYPVRHTLGAALLEAKRDAEAEVAYRTSLRSFPNDGWALHGLAVALDRQGKTAEAASVAAAFEAAWAKADVKLKASRF
jgi:tetratricopeptide (TPR) repeat protein